jgi:thioesterase domain-containing protein
MAADYAGHIMRAHPHGPYVLVGWSMGGVTAHAVAVELERRDKAVALVGAIDSPARNEVAGPLHQLVLALTGVLRDTPGAWPERLREQLRDADLRALVERRAAPAEVLAWCEARGLVPAQAISAARFDAMMRLRYHHFRIVGEHPRDVIRAPMRVWWAERALGDWSPHAGGGVRETIVGGDHFTIVGTPHIETIAAELRAAIGGG